MYYERTPNPERHVQEMHFKEGKVLPCMYERIMKQHVPYTSHPKKSSCDTQRRQTKVRNSVKWGRPLSFMHSSMGISFHHVEMVFDVPPVMQCDRLRSCLLSNLDACVMTCSAARMIFISWSSKLRQSKDCTALPPKREHQQLTYNYGGRSNDERVAFCWAKKLVVPQNG